MSPWDQKCFFENYKHTIINKQNIFNWLPTSRSWASWPPPPQWSCPVSTRRNSGPGHHPPSGTTTPPGGCIAGSRTPTTRGCWTRCRPLLPVKLFWWWSIRVDYLRKPYVFLLRECEKKTQKSESSFKRLNYIFQAEKC